MNIELLLEDFCYHAAYIRDVSPRTVKRYRENIGAFYSAMDIQYIEQVTEKTVQQYFLEGRVEKHWKTSTYRTYYMTLLVFFRWCIKKDVMTTNFAEIIEVPRLKKSLPKGIKQEDALLLLEVTY